MTNTNIQPKGIALNLENAKHICLMERKTRKNGVYPKLDIPKNHKAKNSALL